MAHFLRSFFQALVILTLAAAAPTEAPAATASPIAESSLPNGMHVVVKSDRRAPVVVVMVWYKVGSMDEVNGTTGVAHVLEHMMFKGTKAVPAGEYSRIIAEAGGRDNAFTSRDYTGYFETLHKSQLELAMKLEADRMSNLALTPEEFKKEIRVVMEERRWRTDDRPRAIVFEQMMANTLKAHPYRHPIIGWMSDLENMTAQDAQAWYEKWYAPNNATLVVVGDVSPAEVQKLAARYFGPLKQKTLPPRKITEEPPQLGPQQFTVKAPAELPYVMMAYPTPALRDMQKDWEPFALEMLASVLDGSEAARLNRNLVRSERVASSVDASYDSVGRGPAFFYLSATPAQGKTVQDAERGLRREIERLIKDGVAEEELQRVKSIAVASHVYERDSMFFQARQIGSYLMSDLPANATDLFIDKLKEVTPEQVREVARKYLVDERVTVAYLDPQPLDPNKPRSAPPAGVRDAQ